MADHHHQPTESTPIATDHAVHHHHHQEQHHHHQHQNEPQHHGHHDRHHQHRHHHNHDPSNDAPPPYFYGTEPNNTFMSQQSRNHSVTQYPQNSSPPNATVVWIIKATFFCGFFIIVIAMISSFNQQHSSGVPNSNPIRPIHSHWPSISTGPTYVFPTPTPLPVDPNPYPDQDSADRNCSYSQHESHLAIAGPFTLCESLELTTVTGAIDIILTIAPRTGPATLKIHTVTGPVRIRLTDEHITRFIQTDTDISTTMTTPDEVARQFNTHISTQTGDISMTYLLGNGGTTRVTSQSGILELEFFAIGVGSTDPITELYVNADAEQIVRVKALGNRGEISRIRAEHAQFGVGVLNVSYPESWRGRVEAKYLGNGEFEVGGEGLIVDEMGQGRIVAHRGKSGEDRDVDEDWETGIVVSSVGSGGLNFHC